ncbi:unnamed protein product [Paramecium pentaurelia]|uniref:Uncharacterized protein n=1 Tax=Paramecium pentaurelia TaxID=43138 RepID=A0A8S1TXT1_9CILI|nr:unnamed protein product [Paramecium pentaurelia]
MSLARTSQSSKHQRKSESRFQQQIKALVQNINNPPQNLTKKWIKEKENEQKQLFEEVKQSEFAGRTATLTQLTELARKIAKMRKNLKSVADDRMRTPASDKKSRKSNKSGKSVKSQSRKTLSKLSQSRGQLKSMEQSRSKSSKKSAKGLKSSKTQQTPQFTKKAFENKLGSFSKVVQKENQRPNVRITESRTSKRVADRSISKSKSSRYSSKKKSNNREVYGSYYDDGSSITESSDSKEMINLKVNPKTTLSKYETLVDSERKGQDNEIGQLSREENLMITTKLESISKEKLLREYRVLYYRSKEVRKLLTEYYEQNLTLSEELNELKQMLCEKQLEIKQLKKDLKSQTKELKCMQAEYSTKLDQLGKSYQQQEINSVPLEDYDRIKQENEKLLIENEMINDDYQVITQKLQQIENEIYQKRQYEHPDQDISQRLQRDIDSYKDQIEKIREENIKLKLQLDKEMLNNRELAQQINFKKSEIDGTVELKQQELTQTKAHLQAANQKVQKLEQQINQMKYQIIGDQESSFQVKEKIQRQEEELRIANMKVENREKELNEQKQKELTLKKKIVELEQKVDNQSSTSQTYFEPNFSINKSNNAEQFISKELQLERQFLAKTQEQLLSIQVENEQLKRNLKQLELELSFEKQSNEQIKARLAQLQQEKDITIQRVQKQFEDTENNRLKELLISEQSQKNQENMLYSAQQRINELESELRILNKQEQELKNQINDQKIQYERLQIKMEQNEIKLADLNDQIYQVESENLHLNETNKQLRIQLQQLNREVDQIDRIKDNYKVKYLSNRQENKKQIHQYPEKENMMRQTYTNEVERIRSEKEQLERLKSQEEQQRIQRDKKLQVINDLQQMIKVNKKSFDK